MSGITSAPVEVTLDGQKYMISPMNLEMVERMENRHRSQIIEMAADAIRPSMSRAVVDSLMKGAIEHADQINLYEQEYRAKFFNSLNGVRMIFFEGARVNHPELKWEDAVQLVHDEKAQAKIHAAFASRKTPTKDPKPSPTDEKTL